MSSEKRADSCTSAAAIECKHRVSRHGVSRHGVSRHGGIKQRSFRNRMREFRGMVGIGKKIEGVDFIRNRAIKLPFSDR